MYNVHDDIHGVVSHLCISDVHNMRNASVVIYLHKYINATPMYKRRQNATTTILCLDF